MPDSGVLQWVLTDSTSATKRAGGCYPTGPRERQIPLELPGVHRRSHDGALSSETCAGTMSSLRGSSMVGSIPPRRRNRDSLERGS
jgi:hypothetical protein